MLGVRNLGKVTARPERPQAMLSGAPRQRRPARVGDSHPRHVGRPATGAHMLDLRRGKAVRY
jgi:hypothetical protein